MQSIFGYQGEKPAARATLSANRDPGSQVFVLGDAESGTRRKNLKSLEDCSQILKNTGRAENLVRIDNLDKATASSPIQR